MKKADAASSEVDPECSVVEKKPEEIIADLEAVLTVTAEELEQQKKLNQSLLKRKVSRLSDNFGSFINLYVCLSRISRKPSYWLQCTGLDMCAAEINRQTNIVL